MDNWDVGKLIWGLVWDTVRDSELESVWDSGRESVMISVRRDIDG